MTGYTHVPPPAVPPPDPSAPAGQHGFTFERSGYRVPAIIVSPWVAEGEVFNEEATLYGVVLARRFKAPEVVEGQRVSLPAAAAVAVVFGVALGGAAAVGVALGWTEPYWVPISTE